MDRGAAVARSKSKQKIKTLRNNLRFKRRLKRKKLARSQTP